MGNRVVTKIVGGLGNQMFQYATAYSVAVDGGSSLALDKSWFSDMGTATPRKFELDIFLGDIESIDKNTARWLNFHSSYPRLANFINVTFGIGYDIVEEPSFTYWSGVEKVSGNLYLSGYWQNEKYFIQNRKRIKEVFSFPEFREEHNIKFSQLILSQNQPVSLHVRRGDYVSDANTNSFHGICDMRYYNESMDMILAKYPDAHFFIFSDDPQWVSDTFKADNITVITGNNGRLSFRDMQLMTICRHHILANSSFSWWGAWLSKCDGTTIAPKTWFASSDIDSSDIYAQGWLKL